MAKIRGAKRFFRIGREKIASPYGTIAFGALLPTVAPASSDMRFFFIHEGSFSIHSTNLAEEQLVLRGQTGILFREKTGYSVAGDMSVLTHPDNVKWFFDMALVRDTNGELHPHTIQEFYPGVHTSGVPTTLESGVSYVGCKAGQLAGAWGTGQNKVQLTVSIQGQKESAYATANGIPDPTVAGVFPQKSGFMFTNSSLIEGLSAYSSAWPGGTFILSLSPAAGFTDVSFTIANNLTEGPRSFSPDPELRGAITDLLAGQERLSGNFTLQWKDGTILDRFRNFSDVVFRNIFIHPSSISGAAFTASGSVGAPGTPTPIAYSGTDLSTAWGAGFTPSLTNPAVIAIQHGAAGAAGLTSTNWSTAYVTSVSPTSLSLNGIDVAIATGDRIWSEGMEVRFAQVNILDASKSGGPDDAVVTIAGTFEGKASTGSTQLFYRCRGSVLPAT